MAIRELLLGQAGGKTAWEKLSTYWREQKQERQWNEAFTPVFNPLRIKPEDLVEYGADKKESYQVETILWYQPMEGNPDSVRYGMRNIKTSSFKLLEVTSDGAGQFVYSLFELIDEFEWDDELVRIMEEEEELRRTFYDEKGHTEIIDYQKDFVNEANLQIFDKQKVTALNTFIFNYFIEIAEQEEYLTVELYKDQDWISIYRGKRITEADFEAMGTWLAN